MQHRSLLRDTENRLAIPRAGGAEENGGRGVCDQQRRIATFRKNTRQGAPAEHRGLLATGPASARSGTGVIVVLYC